MREILEVEGNKVVKIRRPKVTKLDKLLREFVIASCPKKGGNYMLGYSKAKNIPVDKENIGNSPPTNKDLLKAVLPLLDQIHIKHWHGVGDIFDFLDHLENLVKEKK